MIEYTEYIGEIDELTYNRLERLCEYFDLNPCDCIVYLIQHAYFVNRKFIEMELDL